jgi:protein transport protein SEC13
MEIDSQHSDMIHDAQFDFYAKQLATCSSDKTIRLHQIDPTTGATTSSQVLKGHSGPVWQVAWSHPVTGGVLV